MLQRGDLLKHFSTRAADGRIVDYRDLWQRKHLVLVCLARDADDEADAYAGALEKEADAIRALEGELIITRQPVEQVPIPGVVVADRWGEVFFVSAAGHAKDLPVATDVLDWLQHAQHQCPE